MKKILFFIRSIFGLKSAKSRLKISKFVRNNFKYNIFTPYPQLDEFVSSRFSFFLISYRLKKPDSNFRFVSITNLNQKDTAEGVTQTKMPSGIGSYYFVAMEGTAFIKERPKI